MAGEMTGRGRQGSTYRSVLRIENGSRNERAQSFSASLVGSRPRRASPGGKTSLQGSVLSGLSFPRNSAPHKASDWYLSRRDIKLPVLSQSIVKSSDGNATGECYLLDGSRTDLLEVAARSLRDDNLIEFNKFKEFNKFSDKVVEFKLAKASHGMMSALRPDRRALHLNRLMLAVVPAVNKGTPGTVTIEVVDGRMEQSYGTLLKVTNPVTAGYVYCVNTGYSVAANDLDYRLRVTFTDVPIKKGNAPIWIKTAFHLDAKADPVFLDGTMSLGASMDADNHTELLGGAAMLLQEVNAGRKSFNGTGDEICEIKTASNSDVSTTDDIGPNDSISQVGAGASVVDAHERGVSFTPPMRSV